MPKDTPLGQRIVLVVIGTRPEQLKMAPVVAALRAAGVAVRVHSMNQSPDLLDPTTLQWDTEGAALAFDVVVLTMVQGDTRTALTAAIASHEAGVPIFHVEAGVRTGDLSSPLPEEGYRRMISQIARYHACTTQHNQINLRSERLDYGNVRVTGSPIIESVLARVDSARAEWDDAPVVTLHRGENRGHFADIYRGIERAMDETPIWWYGHPNGWAAEEIGWARNQRAAAPHEFTAKMAGAMVVITDSGGVQEESCVLGVPCVVARTVTDRPECLFPTHFGGNCILGGRTADSIAAAIEMALQLDPHNFDRHVYGDGTASRQIADWVAEIVGSGSL